MVKVALGRNTMYERNNNTRRLNIRRFNILKTYGTGGVKSRCASLAVIAKNG